MKNYEERMTNVVDDYVRSKGKKSDVVEIYERVFDDYDPDIGVVFGDIDDALEQLKQKEWDSELFDEFLNAVREVIDGGAGSFPESYFDIDEPTNPTLDRLKHELDEKPYRPDAPREEERDGFVYEVDMDGVIHATWYYTSINTGLTGMGTVEKTRNEESIRFRIHPSNRLLVVESTYPIDVQKMKRVIREETPNMDIDVTGVDPTDEDVSFTKRIEEFRESFPEVNIQDFEEDDI